MSIGGNVAECAGGPRAFKYGTTKRYVLGLEAVLATGEVITTGGRTVKNVVGYDLTSLLVGSEGTLAIVTQIVLRLVPKPPACATMRATFASVAAAAEAVTAMVAAGLEPAALELMDGEFLDAAERYLGESLAPPGTRPSCSSRSTASVLDPRAGRAGRGRLPGGGRYRRASRGNDEERTALWRVRRELSYALRTIAPLKFNHDVVVPSGRVPHLFALVASSVTGSTCAFPVSVTPVTATST